VSRFARGVRRQPPSGEPEWTIELPPEWKTAEWRFVAPSHTAELPNGEKALMESAMLRDGTNLFAITWPGGQRLVRISPHTNWAIEERFAGEVPAGCGELIGRLWRITVESAVSACKAAEEEFGGRP
jgi:hypothetical protein